MKRLCIYLTYDKQNIVDKYIGYMLKELKSCINYLAVVCNEREINRGLDILEEYADRIFFRDNMFRVLLFFLVKLSFSRGKHHSFCYMFCHTTDSFIMRCYHVPEGYNKVISYEFNE